jgi:predicted ABC-type ATPase
MMKKIFLFAGPNGAGKSSIIKEFRNEASCPKLYICPDNNIENSLKNNKEAYINAMKIAEKERYKAVEEGKSFVLESVFSTQEKLDFLKFVKSKKYNINVSYIITNDPHINIERIKKRVEQGGHDVPKDKIISRYYKSLNLMEETMKIADIFCLYDNSGETPVLVIQKIFSKKLKGYSFNREIAKIWKWLEQYFPSLEWWR